MAPTKADPAETKKEKKVYVPTGKPRGRRPGQKTKKALKQEKAALMRKSIGKK